MVAPASSTPDREVLITRTFAAPAELVFAAWTDPAQLVRWFAPHGCSVRFPKIDIRTGGKFHSCITIPDGTECWCVGEYREVTRPSRIVYTIAMADAQGNRVSSPEAGKESDWPAESIVTVTFTETEGKTTLTLHQNVSEAVAKRTGAYPSWLQMLDRLAEELGLRSV